MEVDTKTIADFAKVSIVSVMKWRNRGIGPEWVKRGGRYFYPLGALIRWAIDWRVQPLVEQIADLERRVVALETRKKRKTMGVIKAPMMGKAMRRIIKNTAKAHHLVPVNQEDGS